jgi:inner membrane protein
MDSLTQIVLGAAVGEAALGKKVGNKAILWGAIGGTIPDLDVMAGSFADDITALEWHRGFSHSILFALLAAPFFGYLIQRFSKNKSGGFKGWIWLMFLAFLTHPLLDSHTTWGTQLFWPFDLRIAYNNIFVIDPLYTVPFLVFVILAMRKIRGSKERSRLNNLGLIVSSSYMVVTLLLKLYTYGIFQNSLSHQGIEYQRMSTRPTLMNSVLWTSNIETKDSFLIGYYSVFDQNKDVQFRSYAKNHEAISEHLNQDQIKRLIHITKGWYMIQDKPDGLYLCDLRFGELGVSEPTGEFAFRHKILQKDNIWTIEQVDPDMDKAGSLFNQTWDRMRGN